MDEKFNVKLLIILDDPIELSDLFRRASEATIRELELSPPEIRIGNTHQGLFPLQQVYRVIVFKG